MRILHTSDWHLGKKLKAFDREDEQFTQVEHVCQLTEDHIRTMLISDLLKDGQAKGELRARLLHSSLIAGCQPQAHQDHRQAPAITAFPE